MTGMSFVKKALARMSIANSVVQMARVMTIGRLGIVLEDMVMKTGCRGCCDVVCDEELMEFEVVASLIMLQ